LAVAREEDVLAPLLGELPPQDVPVNGVVLGAGTKKEEVSLEARARSRECERERRTSQQRIVRPLSGSDSPGLARKMVGARPRSALGASMPSTTASVSDDELGPASTERAVMKHRKIEPLPTVEATSMRPICSSHRSARETSQSRCRRRGEGWTKADEEEDALRAIHKPSPLPPQVVCVNGEALQEGLDVSDTLDNRC